MKSPINAKSKKAYSGCNVEELLGAGYGDHRWLTYRQGQELGRQVRKGERGTRIVKYIEKKGAKKKGKKKELIKKEYSVFNWEQTDAIPAEKIAA
jgi:antirestriction protein ArdC